MEMKFEGGQWKWVNQSTSFNTRIKVFFKASGKVNSAHVILTDSGASLWALPAGYKTNQHEELTTVSVSKTMLTPFQGKARVLCEVFGGEKKSIRDMSLNAQMQVSQSADVVRKNGDFPVKVVCQPKPNDPQRTPVDLKVTQLKLYTIPAQPVCGQPVQLITEIWTNKPGKVDFYLTRADGPKQAVSVSVTDFVKGQGYVKRWNKSYNHKKSIDLSYQIVAKNQAIASNWTQMKLNCGAGADIGKPKAVKN
jgi:hypothetical protein